MNDEPKVIRLLGLLLALGAAALPLLLIVPVDYEHTAALLAFGVPLFLGRRFWIEELVLLVSRPGIRWFLILSTALLGVATILSDQPAPALVQIAHLVLLSLAALLTSALQRRDAQTANRIWTGLIAGVVLGCTSLGWVWISSPNPRDVDWESFAWMYPHPRHAGLHFLVAALTLPVFAALSPNRRHRALLLVMGGITMAATIWLGGRTPLLGIAAGALAALVRMPVRSRKDLCLAFLFVSLGGMALSTLFWTTDPALGWWRAFYSVVEATDASSLTSTRSDIWRACWGFIKESPVWGHGPDAYRFLSPKMDGPQPHNSIVQIALVAGFPGLLLALAGVGWLCTRNRASSLPSTSTTAAVALVSALAACSLFDGAFYYLLCTGPLALAIGLVLAAAVPKPPIPASSPQLAWAAKLTASVCVAVLSLHAWLFHQLQLPDPPASPSSPPARILRAFPSTSLGLNRWLDQWAATNPDIALEWARWAQTHSATTWYFHLWAAQTLAKSGRQAEALVEFHAYERTRPGAYRDALPK